jgi:hypothetical protein
MARNQLKPGCLHHLEDNRIGGEIGMPVAGHAATNQLSGSVPFYWATKPNKRHAWLCEAEQ